MANFFDLTLSAAVDTAKKGEKTAPISYPELLSVIKAKRDSVLKGYRTKIAYNNITVEELISQSNVNKFDLQRLELKRDQIKDAAEAQLLCAGSDVATRVMGYVAVSDACGIVQAIVDANALNSMTLEDNAEYQRIVEEIESLSEGPNSARIKALKDENAALEANIKAVSEAIEKFLAAPTA
jgi:hypothetical protein